LNQGTARPQGRVTHGVMALTPSRHHPHQAATHPHASGGEEHLDRPASPALTRC
jgi:hypothetical protein